MRARAAAFVILPTLLLMLPSALSAATIANVPEYVKGRRQVEPGVGGGSQAMATSYQHSYVAEEHNMHPAQAQSTKQLVPGDDSIYQELAGHLRDSSWLRVPHDERRRAQSYDAEDAEDRVARMEATGEVEDYEGTIITRALTFSDSEGPITGRNAEVGTMQYGDETNENGKLRYENLRSVYSSTACTDSLAENNLEAGPCTYDCEKLQNFYFPGVDSRCFLYKPDQLKWSETVKNDTGSMPGRREPIEAVDQALCTDPECVGDDLLELKRKRLQWHAFLAPNQAQGGRVEVIHRDTDECTTIVIETAGIDGMGVHSMAGVEQHCLLDGYHEYNHTYNGSHSFEIVGYTDNVTRMGPGGVTAFYVGECTDVRIRLKTTRPANEPVTWALDDGHNDILRFTFPARSSETGGPTDCTDTGCEWVDGGYEFEFCMYQNNFNLTRETGDGWQGDVSVMSYVQDNSIYIPNEENWIIHGANVNNIPVTLQARLSTGFRRCPEQGVFPISIPVADNETSADDDGDCLSQANIVLRNVRLSGQVGTLDKFSQTRTMSTATIGNDPAPRVGGAFYYEGFGSTVIIDRAVFDHNLATSGAALMVDGRMEEQSKFAMNHQESGMPGTQVTNLTIANSFFFRNWATWVSPRTLLRMNFSRIPM